MTIVSHKKVFFCIALIISVTNSLPAQNWEIYNENYELVKKIQNDNIKILGNAVRISTSNNVLRLLNSTYEPFLSIQGSRVHQYLEPWIIVTENDKYGALHEYGDEIFKTEYDHIGTYFNYLLAKKGNQFFYYDRGNKIRKNLGMFESAQIAANGQIIAKTPQGYFLPLSGKPDYAYDLLESISTNVILAKEASGHGLINREGNYILDPVIDKIEYLGDNHFFAHDGKQYMLIRAAEIKADIRYTSYHKITIEDGAILEYIHGKLRRIMKNDGILLDAVGMERVRKIGETHYNVSFRDQKTGLLNENGGWDVRPSENIHEILPGNEGFFGALFDNQYGFVDQSGNTRIQPRFDAVKMFSEGLAAVRTGDFWGYVNANDQIVIDPVYTEAGKFFRGMAIVKKGSKSNLIDKNGKELLPEYYERISLLDDNYYLSENNGKFGLINPFGIEMAKPKHDEIRREAYDKILVRNDKRYGVMMESGEYSLPIYYKNILFDHGNEKVLAEDEYIIPVEEDIETKDKKRKKGA